MLRHGASVAMQREALPRPGAIYGSPSMPLPFPQLIATFALLVGVSTVPTRLMAAEDTRPVMKIVVSMPFTGSANARSTGTVNGAKMAFDEVNWEIAGHRIEFDVQDDASPERGNWDPALEGAIADRAAADADVVAYIGPYNSGAAKISMPKLNAAGVLHVSPSNTATGLTKPGLGEAGEPECYRPSGKVSYFRVVPADDIQGRNAADFAKELGIGRVFIIHDREVYGKGVATRFRERAKAIGLTEVGFDGIDTKASNYRSLMAKVRSSGADLVYFGGTTQTGAGQIAKDLVANGVKAKLLCPDGCFEPAFIEAAGAANLEGRAYITFGGLPPEMLTGPGKDFLDAYAKKYGAGEMQGYAVYGYEAGRVVAEAIKRAGRKDRAAIVAAAHTIKDFASAVGTYSLDANGDTSLAVMSVNLVKDGKFEFVKLMGQ